MAIQYAGGTTVNEILNTSVYLSSIYTRTKQSYNSALNDFKNKLVSAGWTAVLKPTGINISFTGLPTAGQNTTIDGVVYTYRSTFSSSTTLSAAITSTTATVISVTSGTNIVTGSAIQIGSEFMYVVGGGGTAELSVVRGYSGSTPTTHSNGATVNIGCEVLRDSTAALTATNLKDAIVANSGTVGTKFSTGTPAHHSVTAINPVAGWVNVYTKDAGVQTTHSFATTNTGSNITVSGYSSGTNSLHGGWLMYPARTPAGLHGRVSIMDPDATAGSGFYGTISADVTSADGAISPRASSSGLTISINSSGTYTTSATNQGISVNALTVGKEIVVNTTPPQAFMIASVTSTTTGTVTVSPAVPVGSATYSVGGVNPAISTVVVDSTSGRTSNNGFGTPLKVLANKYQFTAYQMFAITPSTPPVSHIGFTFVLPWTAPRDYPFVISSISASPVTGTRFVTVGSHSLVTGDSVYITEVKIDNQYSYFCANNSFRVTVIDSTTFDIPEVAYSGGTYTYSGSDYAIMTPANSTIKEKIVRAMYATNYFNLNTGSATNSTSNTLRTPFVISNSGGINGLFEYSFINRSSFVYTPVSGGNSLSIKFVLPLTYNYSAAATLDLTNNSSQLFSEGAFILNTAINQSGTKITVGQYWDSFIGYASAALDSQIVYDGRIWQNFVSGTLQNTSGGTAYTGSFWMAIN